MGNKAALFLYMSRKMALLGLYSTANRRFYGVGWLNVAQDLTYLQKFAKVIWSTGEKCRGPHWEG